MVERAGEVTSDAPRPSSLSRRALLARLGLGAAATGLALGASELLARLFAPEPLPIRLEELAADEVNGAAIKFTDLLLPDPELFWRFRPNLRFANDAQPFPGLISNSQGLRMDHEVIVPRPARLTRVLCIGDSCTFGYKLLHDQTVSWQLEKGLRERFPGREFECVNSGVPGWTLYQGYRFLQTAAAAYAPQLVIVNFGWNDGRIWDGVGDVDHAEAQRRAEPPLALRSSRLAQLAWKLKAGRPAPQPGRPRLTADEFTDLLTQVQRWTEHHGAGMLLLVGGARGKESAFGIRPRTPYQLAQYQFAKDRPFGPDRGPAFVDGASLEEKLWREGARGPFDIFLDGGHPSAMTNAKLADLLLDKLAPWVESLH